MSESDKDRQLDALLDSALSAYAAVEARPGLEARIRARLATHATQRRRGWMLAFAASATAVLLTVWMLTTWVETSTPAGPLVQQRENKESKPIQTRTTPHLLRRSQSVATRRTQDGRRKTAALLQLANAMHGSDGVIFESEKSYVASSSQDREAVREQAIPEEKINIQNLGVESLEIKELAPEKSDEKGNL